MESREATQKSAESGSVSAMRDLGGFLLGDFIKARGEGTEEAATKLKEATTWLARAAEGGNIESIHELSALYFNGEFVEKDLDTARVWIEKGVELGDPRSINNLGLMHMSGEAGLKKDKTKAFEHFHRSAQMGYHWAQFNAAQCFRKGNGTEQDPERGFEWMSKSAEQELPEALNSLGVMLVNGEGTKEDVDKGIECFKKAYKLGHKLARSNLLQHDQDSFRAYMLYGCLEIE